MKIVLILIMNLMMENIVKYFIIIILLKINIKNYNLELPLPDYNDILALEFENDVPFDVKSFKGEVWFKFPIEHKKFIKKLVMIDDTTLVSIGDDK